jgi:hypothetical protein
MTCAWSKKFDAALQDSRRGTDGLQPGTVQRGTAMKPIPDELFGPPFDAALDPVEDLPIEELPCDDRGERHVRGRQRRPDRSWRKRGGGFNGIHRRRKRRLDW